MSDVLSSTIENNLALPKRERGLDDIQAGQERIRKEFEEYKRLHTSHIQEENEEREGLDDAMDIALEDLRKDLYEILGAKKNGDKLERFKAGLADGIVEKGELVNELRKDPVGFIGKIKEGIVHIFSSLENFANFAKSLGESLWEMLTNSYEMGKGAVDAIIGLALGGAGALGFKTAKRLSKLRRKKKESLDVPDTDLGKSSITGAAGVIALDEGASVIGGKLAKETVEKVWTKAEKLAARPEGIEVKQWKDVMKRYDDYTPEQLRKALEIEDFFEELGIPRNFWEENIRSGDIDTMVVVKSTKTEYELRKYYSKNESGYYYTPDNLDHLSPIERQEILALDTLKNSAENVRIVRTRVGCAMLISKVAPLHGKKGGANQVYIPNLEKCF